MAAVDVVVVTARADTIDEEGADALDGWEVANGRRHGGEEGDGGDDVMCVVSEGGREREREGGRDGEGREGGLGGRGRRGGQYI